MRNLAAVLLLAAWTATLATAADGELLALAPA